MPRDGDRDASLGLPRPDGHGVIDRAARTERWALVLDECHHLLDTDAPEGCAVLELLRGADPFATTTQLRTQWT